ncbi:uncharacterized protein [Asterias amurensis]|uniref:uncharacterized protein n=1 Tax=Asterias amurensis TaxID=7602 RepID=UPI003AB8374A
MVWSSIPWNWVIPLIVLVVLLLFAIAFACCCKFGCKKTPRHSNPEVILHNIDSVQVISNPTCATVFVPVDGKIAGNVIDDEEVDLGLGTNKKTFSSSMRQKKSKTDRVAAANASRNSKKLLVVNSHMDAFTNPESDISLVPMDYRGNTCKEYHNAVDMEHDTGETSESAPMIPSQRK